MASNPAINPSPATKGLRLAEKPGEKPGEKSADKSGSKSTDKPAENKDQPDAQAAENKPGPGPKPTGQGPR